MDTGGEGMPTDEELLRLARKAWPGESFDVWSDGQLHWASSPWASPVTCFPPRGLDGEEATALARKAELAALLVLAGEATAIELRAGGKWRLPPAEGAAK